MVGTYTSGGIIAAADFNALTQNGTPDLRSIFGAGTGDIGYGGNSTNVPLTELPLKAASDLITNEDWLALRNAYADIAAHQGATLPDGLPSVTLLEDNDLIAFFSELDSAADTSNNIAAIDGLNRFNVSPGNLTTTLKLTSTRTTAWSNNIIHEFTVNFGSFDNARFFFNTGGSIRLSASRSGGSATSQNTSWSNLLSSAGTVVFNALITSQTGSGGSPSSLGYYDLTGSFQTIFSQTGAGAYAANEWRILARRDNGPGTNGANGSIIRFRSSFIDNHTGTGGGPDTVDGTFTSTIEERRSTGVFARPTATFATITPLTFGS